MNGQNYNLNLYIQKYEIIKCIQKLKNNKAGGEDAIINEIIMKIKLNKILFLNLFFMRSLVCKARHRTNAYRCEKKNTKKV
jgi:hypothetical protein